MHCNTNTHKWYALVKYKVIFAMFTKVFTNIYIYIYIYYITIHHVL